MILVTCNMCGTGILCLCVVVVSGIWYLCVWYLNVALVTTYVSKLV